jgi:hypothetical protein
MGEMYHFIRQHSKLTFPPLTPLRTHPRRELQSKSIHARILKDKLPATRNFLIWLIVGVFVMLLLVQSY